MVENEKDTDGTRAIRRALRVLAEVVRGDEEELRLTDLVSRSGIGTSTAHRILSCLVEEGLVERGPNRTYRLGARTYEYGLIAQRQYERLHETKPILEALSLKAERTVFMSIRSDAETVCVGKVESAKGPRYRTRIGTRRPVGAGVGGVALLARSKVTEVEKIYSQNQGVYWRTYHISPNEFTRRVEDTRQRGYVHLETRVFGGHNRSLAVAIPVPGGLHEIGLSLCDAAEKFSTNEGDRLLPDLFDAARDIEHALAS